MKNIILLFISFLCLSAFGQTPNITINLPANPNADTSQWGSGSNIFNIFVAGSNMNSLIESDILVTVKSGGSVKCGSYTSTNAPSSTISSNTPKSWIGSSAQGLLGQDCILTPGTYEVCVQFYGSYNSPVRKLIVEKCIPFTILDKEQEICSPPINVNPVDTKVFTGTDLTSLITFNWSPIVSSYRGIVTYRLFVWEVEDGQTNAQAIYNNSPIIQEDIKGQPRYTSKVNTFEKRNAKYVWKVIALDADGNPICKNNQSEPTNFSIEVPQVKSGCIDFEEINLETASSSVPNWLPLSLSESVIKDSGDSVNPTKVLLLVDASGGSLAINDKEFGGNWLKYGVNGCLCFDYKVDAEEKYGALTVTFPKIGIYTGPAATSATAYNSSIHAGFVGSSSNPILKNKIWGKYCLPIELSKSGNLPSNSFGQWKIYNGSTLLSGSAACTAWDNLIQNVTGLVLPSDYNSSPSEKVYFDNFCWTCDGGIIQENPKNCCDETTKEGCLVLDKSKMKIECNGVDKEGKTIYKISGITLKNTSANKWKTGLTSNTAGTNYVTSNPTSSFTVQNILPLSKNPISTGDEVNISFEAHQVTGTSIQFYVDVSILKNNNGLECDKHFLINIDKLPSCNSCIYCTDETKSKITIGSKVVNVTPLNIMTIAQDFTISPKNIKRVTAEIISFEENPVTTACIKCNANESWVNKFISHNTESWNSGLALNGSPVNSDGYYPASMVEWNCNQQGNLKLNFKIALAGKETGCTRKGKIGIRFSFTDIDCITCEKIIYYDYTSN